MRHLLFAVAALFALAAPDVCAQKSSPPDRHSVRIRLPKYSDTESLEIHYLLTGAFGGVGDFIRTKAGVWEYEIDTTYEGKPARSLKAVIYCPGYQAETLDYPSLASSREGADLLLKPLAVVPLSGRVLLPTGVKADGVVVEVSFTAAWECGFFGLIDCLVPRYRKVASAEVAEGGAFSVAVPDYAHDPVISAYERPGHFTFAVAERKSGKYLFSLRPKESPGMYRGVPVANWYPDGQVFEPEAEK